MCDRTPCLYICVGFPGSGKSHWAAAHKAADTRTALGTVIVNRDSIRQMLHGSYAYDPKTEPLVKLIRTHAIREALSAGLDVVVDETHITQRKRDETRELGEGKAYIHYVLFNTRDECLTNRMHDPRGLGREVWNDVIEGMKRDFEPVKPGELKNCEVTRIPPLRLDPPEKEPDVKVSWWEVRQAYAHAVAQAKGWWDQDSDDSRLLMLMVCELAEACEWLRKGNPESDHIPPFLGLEEELADVVIRIMDYAGARELNVAGAIEEKLRFNAEREHKHGGKEF